MWKNIFQYRREEEWMQNYVFRTFRFRLGSWESFHLMWSRNFHGKCILFKRKLFDEYIIYNLDGKYNLWELGIYLCMEYNPVKFRNSEKFCRPEELPGLIRRLKIWFGFFGLTSGNLFSVLLFWSSNRIFLFFSPFEKMFIFRFIFTMIWYSTVVPRLVLFIVNIQTLKYVVIKVNTDFHSSFLALVTEKISMCKQKLYRI